MPTSKHTVMFDPFDPMRGIFAGGSPEPNRDPPRARARRLLASLQRASATAVPRKPALDHRLVTANRGVSVELILALLEHMRDVANDSPSTSDAAQDPSTWQLSDVCAGEGFPVTMCSLTLSTGLSLAESIALVGSKERVATDDLVGKATTFFSCPHDGTTLGEAIDALERALPALDYDDDARPALLRRKGGVSHGHQRLVWMAPFAASQNMLRLAELGSPLSSNPSPALQPTLASLGRLRSMSPTIDASAVAPSSPAKSAKSRRGSAPAVLNPLSLEPRPPSRTSAKWRRACSRPRART